MLSSNELNDSIRHLLSEKRKFEPPKDFANVSAFKSFADYKKLYDFAANEPEKFWTQQSENLVWDKKYEKLTEWNEPYAKWFVGGKLNASVQCLDKNLKHRANKTAILFEGEDGEVQRLSYRELYELTNQTANALKELGVKKGDRIAIYMPMVPEAIASMLACARLGAAHSVIFGGFSAEALKDRINDCECNVVITADGGFRRGDVVELKKNIDEALPFTPSVKRVLVLKRTMHPVTMEAGRDVWWHNIVPHQSRECAPVSVDSEDLLFVLYTSGTTGKPKGIMHSTAGYMLATQLTTKWVFDLKEDDIYWCTADIGWITGHSYVVYGPLQNGSTIFLYEGAPNYPDLSRFWQMIENHKINILYTAPTAIRTFMRAGDQLVNKHDLSSLRLLGTVGEPINPEAWMWYHKVVGGERCPIVDTWWQTETGAIMMSPIPGAVATKPGSCTLPMPGVHPKILKKSGEASGPNEGGFLVLEKPWPSMLRGIWGNPERYQKGYWSEYNGKYFAGDSARCDEDGYFWVVGRVDDVLKVAGHRLGTAEIESALVSHPKVAEAAVVGKPDDIKGQAIVCFVTLKAKFAEEAKTNPNLGHDLIAHVAHEMGPVARPDEIRFTEGLPKTRSGKIMRRLLRELAAHGHVSGDTTTLEDMNVINRLAQNYQDEE